VEILIKVNSKMVCKMEKEHTNGLTVNPTQENTVKTKSTVKDSILMKTAANGRESSMKERKMAS
jgi:hypothetical protein